VIEIQRGNEARLTARVNPTIHGAMKGSTSGQQRCKEVKDIFNISIE